MLAFPECCTEGECQENRPDRHRTCYPYVHRRDQRAYLHRPYPLRPHPFHCAFLLVCDRNKQPQKRRISLFFIPLNVQLQYSKL